MCDVDIEDPWSTEAAASALPAGSSSWSSQSPAVGARTALDSSSPRFIHYSRILKGSSAFLSASPLAHGVFASETIEMNSARGTYNAVTSRTAQKTLLNTALLAFASVVLYILAIVAYWLFYNNYLPDQVTTVPVHLQYGYSLNPYGIASLSDQNLKDSQAYDIGVSLTVPRSPANLNRGNFMVALHLLAPDTSSVPLGLKTKLKTSTTPDSRLPLGYPEYPSFTTTLPSPAQPDPHEAQFADAEVLYTSVRPAIIPYTDPLVSLASRVLFLAYYVVYPHAECAQVHVSMAERAIFARGGSLPSRLFLELQAGQDLQVYSATVTLTAQLHGLRYIMHHYRLASFLVLSAAFWACEVCFMAAAWAAMSLVSSGGGTSQAQVPKAVTQAVPKAMVEDMSDTERTFPSTSRQMPLKYEGKVKSEQEEEAFALEDLPPLTGQGAEADDEDDDDTAFRDSGIGSAYSDAHREGIRRRASGSKGKR